VKEINQILLYGNSLILGSIGDSLSQFPQFEVTTLPATTEEMQKIDSPKPDILLFDLEITRPEAVFSLLESDSNLQLIGISPDVNLVKVWSIRELHELSMQDLFNMIISEANDSLIEPGGDEVRPCSGVELKRKRKEDRLEERF
jgi:hypothetical protein